MSYEVDPRVDAYIDALPEWQQRICREVRAIAHRADPEVEETIKRTRQPYFVLEGNICALLAAKDHVNVFLYDGGIVADPHGIITAGHDNKTARTVAFHRDDPINAAALLQMFRQIIANNRAGGWRKVKLTRMMGLQDRVRIFVENEAGSDLRHTYDEATFKLSSTQPMAAAYPYPYGFILGTTTEDGGAVDCFVLTASPIPTGSTLEGEPVGLLEQFENGEVDHKILVALPGTAPRLDPHLHQTLRSFIGSLFEPFPLVHVEVGRILGAHEARAFIASHRTHGPGLIPDTST